MNNRPIEALVNDANSRESCQPLELSLKVRRGVARYYLTLQLSAAAALPSFEQGEVVFPAPVVRQVPGLTRGRWDEREIVRGRGAEWIITRAQPRPASESSMSWN